MTSAKTDLRFSARKHGPMRWWRGARTSKDLQTGAGRLGAASLPGSNSTYAHDELREACEAEAAELPPETWRFGDFNFNDYLIESLQVGVDPNRPGRRGPVTGQARPLAEVWLSTPTACGSG